MARFKEAHGYTLIKDGAFIIRNAFNQAADPLGINDFIERDLGVAGPASLLLVTLLLIGSILFLQVSGIKEDDREEVGAGRSGQDALAEAVTDELGEKPGVVEMDMGEEDEIDRFGRDGEMRPVPLEIGSFLKETAVDEQPEAVCFDEKTGPRNLLCSAKKLDLQF
jgi:hypothetical protein